MASIRLGEPALSLGTQPDPASPLRVTGQIREERRLVVTGLLLVTIGLMLASQFVPPRAVEEAQVRFTALGPGVQVLALAGALTLIDVLGPDGVAPFIYFRF